MSRSPWPTVRVGRPSIDVFGVPEPETNLRYWIRPYPEPVNVNKHYLRGLDTVAELAGTRGTFVA